MSGYFAVQLDLTDVVSASAVDWVQVGDIPAYGLVALEDDVLEVQVQGHPTPGPVEVTLGAGETTHLLGETFLYDPARLPGLSTMHAVGASLTEGTQRGLPTQRSILRGPAAQLAHSGPVPAAEYCPLPQSRQALAPLSET